MEVQRDSPESGAAADVEQRCARGAGEDHAAVGQAAADSAARRLRGRFELHGRVVGERSGLEYREPRDDVASAALAEAVRGPVHRRRKRRDVTAHPVRELLGHRQRHALLQVQNVGLQRGERLDEVRDAPSGRRAAEGGGGGLLGEAGDPEHVVGAHPHDGLGAES